MDNTNRKPTSQKRGASRVKKEAIITDFKDKFSRAKAVVFTNYQGMTHKQIESLKKAIKAADAEFVVTKNTLLARAMEDNKWKMEKAEELKGPTATIFSFKDIIAPIKELVKTIKLLNLPVIKFGIMEGRKITSDDVKKLSAIPSREILLTQLAVGLKSSIFGLHRALNWNLQILVMTLKAVEKKKA